MKEKSAGSDDEESVEPGEHPALVYLRCVCAIELRSCGWPV